MFKKLNELLDRPITWRSSMKVSLITTSIALASYGVGIAALKYQERKAIEEMRQEEYVKMVSEIQDLKRKNYLLENEAK